MLNHRPLQLIGLILLIALGNVRSGLAQGGGSFGGMSSYGGSFGYEGGGDYYYGRGTPAARDGNSSWANGNSDYPLTTESALNVIRIDGTAEQRVVPDQIRVVLAITSQGETAAECQAGVAGQIDAITQQWKQLQIPDDRIVEDFIAVLPLYEWHKATRDDEKIQIQELVGYRMQTNVHVAVSTESEAMEAINAAFRHGASEIITFDYWSSDLDKQKQEVRAKAVAAAKQKAETLLSVFDERPKVINIQESTAAIFPQHLYRTFENVLEEEVTDYGSGKTPRIKAFRPKMTFYQGLTSRSDVRPEEVVMKPEIAVVSTVRLYYQSPAGAATAVNAAAPK